MTAGSQTFSFQAETRQLLHLVIHSLYTAKDIFLRELISNSSDALDRLRFESLTRPELLEGNDRFEIRLTVDRAARTLTISDTGIGMSREELIANIGTIAKSGTADSRVQMRTGGSAAEMAELIGQFGVGFYSAFMVADQVKLVSRRAGERGATEWQSSGDGTYTITDADKTERGTAVTLVLKNKDSESGIEDYTDHWVLSRIIRKHSDFISYPIVMRRELREQDDSSQNPPADPVAPADTVLNSMKPIWRRSPGEVKPEDYQEFYQHIAHDWDEPLRQIHFRAEGTFEFQALLYIPGRAAADLYYVAPNVGLQLYAKRIMIIEKCEDLLPQYLRFMRGVVDAGDLPLNISRQRLQQDHHIAVIRKRLTRKILEALQDMFDNAGDLYTKLWSEFGRAIKEGVTSDHENRPKLIPLLLFPSSHAPAENTTLQQYVARMKPEQDQILYLAGESPAMIENSPHVEAAREKGYEVLYMVDPVDELLLQQLPEFEGRKLKSVGKGAITFGTQEQREQAAEELKQKQEEYKPFLEFLQQRLSQYVKDVRLSSRLTKSPACLVVDDHQFSPLVERVLAKGKRHEPGTRRQRVLEFNAGHPLIVGLQQRFSSDPHDAVLARAVEMLYGVAVLAEGSELPDPVGFNRACTEILTRAVEEGVAPPPDSGLDLADRA